MASEKDIRKVLDDLNGSGGTFNLKNIKVSGGKSIKEEIIKRKIKMGYTVVDQKTGEPACSIGDDELDNLTEQVMKSGNGEMVNKIDSDLDQVSNSLNSVISQAPLLLTQMATIPATLIQISPVGPTMPNPLDIKNSLGQIKAQANALSSILSQALSKILELGVVDLIPGLDVVMNIAKIIGKIKNFGG